MPTRDTLDRVKSVVRSSLKLGADTAIADDMPLVGGEYDLDSLDMLLVVTNIEKEFGMTVADRSVGRQAFTSVSVLASFVEGQRPQG